MEIQKKESFRKKITKFLRNKTLKTLCTETFHSIQEIIVLDRS